MNKGFILLAALFVFAFDWNVNAQNSQALYDYGFGEISKKHKTYKNDSRFSIYGPTKVDKVLEKCGYSQCIVVSNESVSFHYLLGAFGETLTDISLDEKSDYHPLAKYIGSSFEEFKKKFPLQETDKPSSGTTFFWSDKNDKYDIAVVCVDGIIDGIQIRSRNFKKKYAKAMKDLQSKKK